MRFTKGMNLNFLHVAFKADGPVVRDNVRCLNFHYKGRQAKFYAGPRAGEVFEIFSFDDRGFNGISVFGYANGQPVSGDLDQVELLPA